MPDQTVECDRSGFYDVWPRTGAVHESTCTFCKDTISAGSRHYHVSNVGNMCISCLDKTTVYLKPYGQQIRLKRRRVHP